MGSDYHVVDNCITYKDFCRVAQVLKLLILCFQDSLYDEMTSVVIQSYLKAMKEAKQVLLFIASYYRQLSVDGKMKF